MQQLLQPTAQTQKEISCLEELEHLTKKGNKRDLFSIPILLFQIYIRLIFGLEQMSCNYLHFALASSNQDYPQSSAVIICMRNFVSTFVLLFVRFTTFYELDLLWPEGDFCLHGYSCEKQIVWVKICVKVVSNNEMMNELQILSQHN